MTLNVNETSASQQGSSSTIPHTHITLPSCSKQIPSLRSLLLDPVSFFNPFPSPLLHCCILLARPVSLGPSSSALPRMATTVQNEQVYDGNKSVGVAVSLYSQYSFPNTCLSCSIFSPLGARCLRYALVNFCFGHVCYSRGMYHFTRQSRLEFCSWLTYLPLPLPPSPTSQPRPSFILRCQWCGVAALPTKRFSFAHTSQCTFFAFFFATSFKA